MARQPYFSGNYGSALAQIDTRPIMQGAAAQAAAYQGIGQNMAGAIEKYQLNKQKRERNEAAAIGTMAGMPPEMLQALSANPETAKLMERIQGANASPKDFDKFNAMSAAYTVQQKSTLEQDLASSKNAAIKSGTLITDLQGQLAGLTQDEDARKVRLGNAATELAMEQVQADMDLAEAKEGRDKDEAKVRIKHLGEQVRGLKLAGDFTDLTWEERVSEVRSKAEQAKANVKLTKVSTKAKKADALLTKAKTSAEGVKGKTGQVRKFGGVDHLYNGVSWQPIAGQITQKDLDSTAFKIFGDELPLYRENTRNDITGKINDPDEIDPQKERLMIMLKMGTLGELEGLKGLEAGVLDEIKGLMGVGATSGTTDRVALARQALQDPNATPQVKEQAKRILQMAGQ